jgi:hypothetical protein
LLRKNLSLSELAERDVREDRVRFSEKIDV